MKVEFASGNIADQVVDAIVNAANSSLLGGGGVDGAIHRAAGPALLAACQELRNTTYREGLPAGQAVATAAGKLHAKWVIHTVGPVYGSRADAPAVLAACFTNSLAIADELGARTLAVPAVSTGVYGWPLDDCAHIARTALDAATTQVELVRFVIYEPDRAAAFRAAYESVV